MKLFKVVANCVGRVETLEVWTSNAKSAKSFFRKQLYAEGRLDVSIVSCVEVNEENA